MTTPELIILPQRSQYEDLKKVAAQRGKLTSIESWAQTQPTEDPSLTRIPSPPWASFERINVERSDAHSSSSGHTLHRLGERFCDSWKRKSQQLSRHSWFGGRSSDL